MSLLPAERNDGVQSTSSSNESLSSRSSRELPQPLPSSLSSSPQTSKRLPLSGAPPKLGANGPHRDYRVQQTNHFTYNSSTSHAAFASTTYLSFYLDYSLVSCSFLLFLSPFYFSPALSYPLLSLIVFHLDCSLIFFTVFLPFHFSFSSFPLPSFFPQLLFSHLISYNFSLPCLLCSFSPLPSPSLLYSALLSSIVIYSVGICLHLMLFFLRLFHSSQCIRPLHSFSCNIPFFPSLIISTFLQYRMIVSCLSFLCSRVPSHYVLFNIHFLLPCCPYTDLFPHLLFFIMEREATCSSLPSSSFLNSL